MANEHMATYLNDHLAGSVAALGLLAHLESAHEGTPLAQFFAELQADIKADRQQLEILMERLNISESNTRKVTAWVAEKFTELKLKVEDPSGSALRLLEALDAVASGIEGKRALWLALIAAAESVPNLRGTDYERLVQRAEEQRHRLEEVRLQAARAALGTTV